MNVIIPAAGLSSRFPNLRPKWLLTHPSGNLMVAEAIRGLTIPDLDRIYLAVLADHLRTYRCREGIQRQFQQLGLGDRLTIVELEVPTRSQPETVARTIADQSLRGPICIKDVDNYCRLEVIGGNFVAVGDLNTAGCIHAGNKSYAVVTENRSVVKIVEKRVISNFFSCGTYGFEKAEEFLQCYEKLAGHGDLHVSHLVQQMITENSRFTALPCAEYADWGTLEDWNRYKAEFGTLFIDLDGVLVENSAEYFEPFWGQTSGIAGNICAVNRLYDSGRVQVIITTSRKESARDVTRQQLERVGVRFHQVIFGLNHGMRIVVNDYARSNPYPTCDALNIARNSSDLAEMLKAWFDVDRTPHVSPQ